MSSGWVYEDCTPLDRSVSEHLPFGIVAALQRCVSVRVHFAYDFAFASLPVICVCSIARCMLCKEACRFCAYSKF